jgi:hypothetical protein
VTAASNWSEPAERKPVLPALPESYEACFHETEFRVFLLSSVITRLPRLYCARGDSSEREAPSFRVAGGRTSLDLRLPMCARQRF